MNWISFDEKDIARNANVIKLSVIIVIPSKMATQWVAILRGNPSFCVEKRIAEPVCELARNDNFLILMTLARNAMSFFDDAFGMAESNRRGPK